MKKCMNGPAWASFLMFIGMPFAHALQVVPVLMNYQGRLTDQNGNVVTGTVEQSLTFELYDDDGSAGHAGARVWGPMQFDVVQGGTPTVGHRFKVPVVDGYFNVNLAEDVNGVSIQVPFASGPNRYLAVKIGANAAIVPRQRISSTPYAFQAQAADAAQTAVSAQVSTATLALPAGIIVPWMGGGAAPIPTGWLLCNGSSIPVGTQYDALRAIMVSTATPGLVPDLRGVFLRGLDSGKGLDVSGATRVLGDFEPEDFETHNHTSFSAYNFLGGGGTRAVTGLVDPPGPIVNSANNKTTDTGGAAPLSETRPDNVSVNYLIKY